MADSNMQLKTWAGVLILGILSVAFLLRRRKGKYPPGPWVWPIVGCIPSLPRVQPREVMLAKLAEKYGEIMLLWMGARPMVVVTTPRMASEILKIHDHEFANRPNNMVFEYISFSGTSLVALSSTNPLFKRTRRIFATEILSARKVAQAAGVRKGEILKMLQATAQEFEAGRCVNLSKAFPVLAMKLAICTSFGRDFSDKLSKEIESFTDTFRKMLDSFLKSNVADLIPSLRWLDLQGIEAELKILEVQLRKSVAAMIDKKREEMSMWSAEEIQSGAYERDVMTKLLSMEGEDQFNQEQLMSVAFTFLSAGTDTVYKVMTAATDEVLKHPDIYKRALDELDAVVGTTRLVEESDIPNLPFLQNIIKEILRLRPPGPILIPHRNYEACEVAGYQIPANSTVMVNLYSLGRDPAFWDSPHEFSPDRFTRPKLANLTMQGSDFHYIPFGFGKRACPGLSLGLVSVQYALALCLQCISWDLDTPRPASFETSDDGAVGGKMPVNPRPRLNFETSNDLVVGGKLRVNPSLFESALQLL